MRHIFTLPELRALLEDRPEAVQSLPPDGPASLTEFAEQLGNSGDVDEAVERQLNGWMQGRIAEMQDADRRYWRPIIAELKLFRSGGNLSPEGTAV